jgi:excinuclease UvrABC nuclease subunit
MSLSIEEQRNKIREIKNIEIESKKSKINKKNFKVVDFFNISGIYFLKQGNKIVYVGESTCIMSRIVQHYKENVKQFDSFQILENKLSNKQRLNLEKRLIKKFRPKYNIVHNDNKKKSIKLVFTPF